MAAVEEAVKVQGEDSYVINVEKDGQLSGCKLSFYLEHARSEK